MCDKVLKARVGGGGKILSTSNKKLTLETNDVLIGEKEELYMDTTYFFISMPVIPVCESIGQKER